MMSMQGSKATSTVVSKNIPYDAMIQLVTILYCRSIFHDFRVPVEILYPSLASSYLSIIKSPMDHGTLLVKLMNNEFKSIDEFRRCLQLVHNNAMLFNQGNIYIYIFMMMMMIMIIIIIKASS